MPTHHLDPEYQQSRLDRYLRKLYPLLTQGIIQKALRKKQIRINDYIPEAKSLMKVGDVISVPEYFTTYSELPKMPDHVDLRSQALAKNIYQKYIILDHAGFIAINKPAGLATQGGSKIDLSIDHALQILSNESITYKLVHRLDKDTSGVLLIAKNHLSAVRLAQAFKDRVMNKLYLGVLSGIPDKSSGIISSQDSPDKESITSFKILATNADLNICLCLFKPYTGRMHQLRHHSMLLGYPLIGDKKYGNSSHPVKSSSLKLHAYILKLPVSLYNQEIILSASLPPDFTSFIQRYLGIEPENLSSIVYKEEESLPIPYRHDA